MDPITCPVCETTAAPAALIERVAVCAGCGASLHMSDDGGVRRATAAETSALSSGALQTLQQARGRIARPDRRQR